MGAQTWRTIPLRSERPDASASLLYTPTRFSSEDHPEGSGLPGAEVLPAVRRATVEERAVTLLEDVAVAIVVERHPALEHVEQLHLPGLDDDLVRVDPARLRPKRRDDRPDLALEQ